MAIKSTPSPLVATSARIWWSQSCPTIAHRKRGRATPTSPDPGTPTSTTKEYLVPGRTTGEATRS